MIYTCNVVHETYIFQLVFNFMKTSWWSSAVCYSFLQTKNNLLSIF